MKINYKKIIEKYDGTVTIEKYTEELWILMDKLYKNLLDYGSFEGMMKDIQSYYEYIDEKHLLLDDYINKEKIYYQIDIDRYSKECEILLEAIYEIYERLFEEFNSATWLMPDISEIV